MIIVLVIEKKKSLRTKEIKGNLEISLKSQPKFDRLLNCVFANIFTIMKMFFKDCLIVNP